MRQAAATWNVNLHTVRHAYAALARDGLVERLRGRKGTRVLEAPGGDRPTDHRIGLGLFVSRVAEEAAERFGASPTDLARELTRFEERTSDERPRVWIVECSAWQCACHGREITDAYDVDARTWLLDRAGEPTAGTVLSTYFHYNDLRRLWPRRLSSVQFLTIHPDPALAGRLSGVDRVIVAERDASTVEAITADLLALFDEREIDFAPFVSDDPASALKRESTTPILFAPRVWANLSEKQREHPCAIELRYVFDHTELSELAGVLNWAPKRLVQAQGESR